MNPMPSLLIAIASYGTAQDNYLEKLLAEYRNLRMPSSVVVLSNQFKPVRGAEVIVGLPSSDPYSLPFAHRKLFAENAEKFDLYVYTEDDTLLSEKHIEAFLDVQAKLEKNEIPGFLRSETSPEGKRYITSIHHHFRWLPDTVVRRDGEIFAQLSNQHSGCFIATREQLRIAIASGGFLVEPRSRVYGMLETAASDIYTQCGLRRLLCISRIHEFIVPHLANKYYSQMGVCYEELAIQAKTLGDLYQKGNWRGSLFNPQTKAPGFRWSKNLYDKPDEELLRTVPPSVKNLLSIGSGSGANEEWLRKNGIDVCAVPVDAVFGEALRSRGIRTVEGPLDKIIESMKGERFDMILISGMLHLVNNPVNWLTKLGRLLSPEGILIADVCNTSSPLSWLRDWRDGQGRTFSPNHESIGAHYVNARRLRSWCRSSGLEVIQIIPLIGSTRRIVRQIGRGPLKAALSERFILKARRPV
jgi:SAM-dependent methyltransferase